MSIHLPNPPPADVVELLKKGMQARNLLVNPTVFYAIFKRSNLNWLHDFVTWSLPPGVNGTESELKALYLEGLRRLARAYAEQRAVDPYE